MRLHLSRIENPWLRHAAIIATFPLVTGWTLIGTIVLWPFIVVQAVLASIASAAPAWRGEHYRDPDAECGVGVSRGALYIRMPVKLLAFAVEHGHVRAKVTDPTAFAKAVGDALLYEPAETGGEERTLIHKLFDDAAERAIEAGVGGVEVI